MPTTGHPTPADLQAFVLGTLPDQAAGAVESHLSSCSDCQQAAADAADDTLVNLLRSADTSQAGPVTPGTGFAETVGLAPGADADLRPAELVDHPRYRPIRPLGRGGMGHVWLAEHTVMGRPVALKLVRPEFLDRPEAVERFRREVRAAARLNHPNIVAAHDAEQAGGTHFLVMEFIDGDTLAERVAAGPVPVEDACKWVIDAARGLEHARQQGLIHRDVKPHNLIRERATGRVKVLDFGLAGVTAAGEASGLTGGNVVIGTPDYIAPEQAMDARKADTRSDVYSLGCTLYHLLAGRPPFVGETVLQKIDAHRHDEPEPLTAIRRDMTPALAELVARMMAKDPKDRPQTPGEVAVALEELLAGRGGEPPTPNRRRRDDDAGERGRRWLLRRIGQVAVITLGVLVGAVVYRLTDEADISVSNEAPDQVKWVIKKDGYIVSEPSSALSTGLFLPAGGEYTVEVDRPDEFVAFPKSFAARRGEKLEIRIVRVSREPQPAAAGPAEPAPFLLRGNPNAPFTDLIAFVDPSRDREAGSFGSYSQAYLTVASDKAGPARIALQARPDGDYEFRARAARVSGDGSFNLMLPVPGTDGKVQIGVLVDALQNREGLTALDWDNGPTVSTVKTFGDRLQPGRQYLVLGRVTRLGDRVQVEVSVGGIKVLDWTGPATPDRNGRTAFTGDRRQLGFGATAAEFRIDRLELRMLNGTADLTRRPTVAPRAASAGPGIWTDLLRDLKLPVAIVDGTWGWSNGFGDVALIGGNPKAGKAGRMALPVRPNGDYELRARFQRVAGDDCLTVMLPIPGAAGAQAALVVDGYAAQGGFVGLEYVNKKPAGRPIRDALGGRLQNKTTYLLHVRVTGRDGNARVRADIDVKPVLDWSGPVADLTPSLNWFTPDRAQIGLGVWDDCQFRIESLEYRSGVAPEQQVAPVEPPGLVRQFARFKGIVDQLLLSADGAHAYAGDDDVVRWNVQTGETEWVAAQPGGSILALSGDGKVLTVWAQDGSARVLDPASGKELRQFPIPPEPVAGAVLNRDGTRAFVSQRGTDKGAKPAIRAWDVVNGKVLFRLDGHTTDTYGIALSPDGTRVATGSYDKSVRLWDAATGKELHAFGGHTAELTTVAFSADGKFIASGGGDKLVRVWGVEQKRCVSLLSGHTTWVLSAAFTPDGSRLITGAGYDGKGDGVRVWDWRTGEQLGHFPEARGMVGSVGATPDGRQAVTTEDNGQIRVWRLPPPPAPVSADAVGPVRRFGRFTGGVPSVARSKDGSHLYSLDTAVVKWDRRADAVVWAHGLNADGNFQVAATADDKYVLAGCSDGTVRVLDAATGRERRRFTKHQERIVGLAVSADSKRAASCSGTKDPAPKFSVRVWEIETGQELFELKGATDETWGIQFSPDGSRIATASDDGQVRLWDAKTGAPQHTFPGHRGMASAVAFSPDGKRLASGGQDLAVHVWDVEKRTAVRKLEGHTVWVSDVAFTPDGTRIVSVGASWAEESSDGLRVWDAADGTPLYRGAPGRTQDVGLAVGPDGRYAVTGGIKGALWEWRLPEAPKR